MAPGGVRGRSPKRRLYEVRAKSEPHNDPERLTTHSRAVHAAVAQLRARIGEPELLRVDPRWWQRIAEAALLHDAGKVALGFQRQLLPRAPAWGERHEVLSLAYVDLLARAVGWDAEDRLVVGTLVATHHRALLSGNGTGGKPALAQQYNSETDWTEAFTARTRQGEREVQVTASVHHELTAWLAGFLRADPPQRTPDEPRLAERARLFLEELFAHWRTPVDAEAGLRAVLAQGALTLADHAGSAHSTFQTHLPLPADYLDRLPNSPYPHQETAAATDGHLLLRAPTGSGKTEAGLAWAAHQLQALPGQPRVVWTLPYRASLHAIRDRFEREDSALVPAPGQKRPEVGLLHGSVAGTLLHEALDDERPPARAEQAGRNAALAKQARARAAVMRLFAHRLRVSTPHQLLRAAVSGPAYSSALLEQSGSLFVLDELHAYDPETFGRLCAAMRLWEQLGSRIAVLSATLAPQMIELVEESLREPVTCHRAPPGTSPERHRLVLDDEPLTSSAGLARVRGWLLAGYSVLVVVNTVVTAQRVFDQLAHTAREMADGDDDAALLLHSRFRNVDRSNREETLLRRHGERQTAEEPPGRGGLVVATQAVEVSLTLDLDRGAVEAAPIEAVAQRAGRVNRRGRHPEGTVEFRVHRPESHRPYEADAVAAAWYALQAHEGSTLGEEEIDNLLAHAYATPWGESWKRRARRARDDFAETFLTFTQPFHDRSEFADQLTEQLDGTEVLWEGDREEYESAVYGPEGDPLLGQQLLIPLRWGQLTALKAPGRGQAWFDRSLGVHVTNCPYDERTGLDLSRPPEPETVV